MDYSWLLGDISWVAMGNSTEGDKLIDLGLICCGVRDVLFTRFAF